jgi:anti-sigma factor RsiW
MTPPVDDFPCNLFVEVITDYLDGAMEPNDARRLEAHLSICAGCASVLDQFRVILRLTGRIGEHDVDALSPAEREPLLRAFREWSTTG